MPENTSTNTSILETLIAAGEALISFLDALEEVQPEAESKDVDPAQARARFMEDNAELLAQATTVVLIGPGVDGGPNRVSTLALPGPCTHAQGALLRSLATRLEAEHPAGPCKS